MACLRRNRSRASQSRERVSDVRARQPQPLAGDDTMKWRWPWEKHETRAENDPSWAALIPSGTSSGLPVSPGNAETISTVFSCVQSIAETIGGLPLILYRREGNGDRVRASDHPLYRVLHDAPNERQTALEFREQLTAHVLL